MILNKNFKENVNPVEYLTILHEIKQKILDFEILQFYLFFFGGFL